MKAITLALIIFSLSMFSTTSHSATYTVAAYPWEPFIDPSRSDGGISIKILQEVMLSQGHEIDVQPMPWGKALAVTEKGDVDILPGIWFSEERDKIMHYSEPYTYNRIVFVKHKSDSYEYKGIDSLNGKKVGIIKNYAYNEELLANGAIQFSKSSSLVRNMENVASQRIDLTLDDEIVIKATTSADVLANVAFTKDAFSEKGLSITCYKSNRNCESIISSFNKGLKEMQENGKLKTLLDQLGI